MKKICYVTTLSSSIKAFFIPQLKYLSENGYDVTVICSSDAELADRLGAGIKFIPVEMPRGISVFGSFRAIKELKKVFKREKFDIVQYSTPNAAFYSAISSKQAGAKIRNYHLMGLRYLGESGLKRKILFLLEKIACKNSTHIECVSKSNLELAHSEGLFPKSKGSVVWNGSSGGIDLDRFDYSKREQYRAEIRKKYGIGKNEMVFGFVGRITRDKGINEIMTAFQNIPDAKLFMIGSEEGTETLIPELYNASKSSDRYIYTGNVNDVERYYCALDVLLFPSYREGFGNVVIEAAAMGTPAIISNIPGPIDAVIDGETAYTVPAHDAKTLEQAMKKIMENNNFAAMSDKACAYARNSFDSKILCEKILAAKNRLVK